MKPFQLSFKARLFLPVLCILFTLEDRLRPSLHAHVLGLDESGQTARVFDRPFYPMIARLALRVGSVRTAYHNCLKLKKEKGKGEGRRELGK